MLLFYFILTIIFSYIAYTETQQNKYIKKNICFIFFIGSLITLFNTIFNIQINIYTFMLSLLFIKFVYNSYKARNIKSDILNKENVFLAVYKPRDYKMSLKSFFGTPLASICFLMYVEDNYYFYQFKLDKECMQKIPLNKEKMEAYLQKYILINTKYEVNKLNSNFEELILKRRRKTLNGIWRLNCLLSIKEFLDKMPNFKVRFYEFLPCLYINRIIYKINNERKNACHN